jgi:GntR family transcriptional regulator
MTLDKAISAKAVDSVPRDGEGRGGRSTLIFRLDPSSGVPSYAQLVQQVEHALRLGYLRPEDQLPKVREVVSGLAVNPNTVLKAYKELEDKGLVVGRPGQGTFVVGTLEQVDLAKLLILRRSLLSWLARASAVGLDEDGMVALFTTALRDFLDDRSEARSDTGPARRPRAGGQGEVTA